MSCDTCDAGAWIGLAPAPGSGTDAWCEACQRAEHLSNEAAPKCPACGGPLTTGAPRFLGLWGELRRLEAVLTAWIGDPKPLVLLLPDWPQLLPEQQAAAHAELAPASDGREARWSRAALRVQRAVSSTPGMPDPREIALAREEAGPAPADESEPTVGRLAFSLLAERALARREAGEFGDLDVVALRKGEDLLEHQSFWDRALVLVAHARLDNEGDATRVARPLARELAAALLAEPAMKGAALAGANAAVSRAWDEISAFKPREALAALQPLLDHDALKRYRLPCVACGRGTLGADAWDEARVAHEHDAG